MALRLSNRVDHPLMMYAPVLQSNKKRNLNKVFPGIFFSAYLSDFPFPSVVGNSMFPEPMLPAVHLFAMNGNSDSTIPNFQWVKNVRLMGP